MHKLVLVLLVLFPSCESAFNPFYGGPESSSDEEKKENTKNNDKNGDLDGEALYQLHCSSCHGASAEGTAIWEASIQAYEPIESIVIDGRGTMAAIDLSKGQTTKIQNFLLTLGTKTEDLDGKGLYDRYCASCHGMDASGTKIWKGSIQAYEPIDKIVNDGRGTMDPVTLETKQVGLIQTYLLTLGKKLSELSGPEVYSRLCVGCHGDKGAGDKKGMQLRYDDIEFSRYWIRAGRDNTLSYPSAMPKYPDTMISNKQIDEMFMEIDAVAHPKDGKGLYDQYCANCHALDGRGGPSGEGIRGGDEYSEKIRKGKGGKKYGKRRSYMTKWSKSQLSNDEVSKIRNYGKDL